MELINIKQKNSLNTCLNYLKQGKIVVLPTDTIYGFSCLATNLLAIEKIGKIKKRKNTSFIILVSDYRMLKKYSHLGDRQKGLIEKHLKKRNIYSFVLEAKNLNKPYPNKGSLAIRLPKSDFLIKLIAGLKIPIISTSLNLHKQKLIELENIESFFKNKKLKPDLVVIDKDSRKSKSSKIIDIRYNKIVKLR